MTVRAGTVGHPRRQPLENSWIYHTRQSMLTIEIHWQNVTCMAVVLVKTHFYRITY